MSSIETAFSPLYTFQSKQLEMKYSVWRGNCISLFHSDPGSVQYVAHEFFDHLVAINILNKR